MQIDVHRQNNMGGEKNKKVRHSHKTVSSNEKQNCMYFDRTIGQLTKVRTICML